MNNNKAAKKRILFTTQLSEERLSELNDTRFTAKSIPFITIEYLMPSLWKSQVPEHTDAWIFTSKKAVKAIQPMIEELEVPDHIFAVGSKTAARLEKLGLEVTVPDEYNAASLARKMQEASLKQVVHFCGNLKAADFSRLLRAETTLTSIEVYRTKLTGHKIEVNSYDGIVFMSPSSVESFTEKNTVHEDTQVFCIGPTTEEAAREAGIKNSITPEYSTLDSLIESIQEFYL